MKKNITITALLNLIFISPTWGQYDAEKEAIANDPYSAAAAHNAARQSLWSMSNADITTIERPVFSTGQGWGTERAWHSTRPNITVTRRPAHATSNQSGNTYSSNATVYQSGGIQFSYDSPVSTSRRQPSTHAQQEADRKRKRDIERHEFYERKREAAARAAEAERIRQEAKKREQERIRAQVTAATYVALGPSTQAKQDAAYYRAHERVYEGAEQHTSSHLMNVTEGNNFGQGDYTTPNRNFKRSLRKETPNEGFVIDPDRTYHLATWDNLPSEDLSFKNEDYLRLQDKTAEIIRPTQEAWDEIRGKLDEENFHLLAYILKSNNGGETPTFLGITDSGRYIFESADGNNVFSVSKDGKGIQTLTFEEHSWTDENIIAAIREKGFNGAISDRLKFECPDFYGGKGGTISFKDLPDLSVADLRKLLPQIKAELKLKLIDHSSTLTYGYTRLYDSHISISGTVSGFSGIKDNTSFSVAITPEAPEMDAMLGGKDLVEGTISVSRDGTVNKTERRSDGLLYDSYSKSYGPIRINAKTSIDFTSGGLEGRIGYVKKVGDFYYYVSGGVEANGGTRLDKNIVKGPLGIFYGDISVGGIQYKNITDYTDNIPTLK